MAEAEGKFSQEQYEILKRCSKATNTIEWATWLQKNQGIQIDLSGADLRGYNLNGIYLGNALCVGAKLSRANLQNANLDGADFNNASFRWAMLTNSTFSNAKLSSANLSDTNLNNALLDGANLHGANLSNAKLQNVNLKDADLSNANLSSADLTSSKLNRANLTGAKLENANLQGTKLARANFAKAKLAGAQLQGADLNNAKFNGADLNGANLYEVDLRNAIFTGANLTGVHFGKAFAYEHQFAPNQLDKKQRSDLEFPEIESIEPEPEKPPKKQAKDEQSEPQTWKKLKQEREAAQQSASSGGGGGEGGGQKAIFADGENELLKAFKEFLVNKKHVPIEAFSPKRRTVRTGGLDILMILGEENKKIAIVDFSPATDNRGISNTNERLRKYRESSSLENCPAYIVCRAKYDKEYPFDIYQVTDTDKPEPISYEDFPTYAQLLFASPLSAPGRRIYEALIRLAKDEHGFSVHTPCRDYIDLQIKKNKRTAAQIHRLRNSNEKVALVLAGYQKDFGPEWIFDFVNIGDIEPLTGYSNKYPGEKNWLEGNLGHPHLKYKASVFILKPGVLVLEDIKKEVGNLLKAAKKNAEKGGGVEPEVEVGEISQGIAGVRNDNVVDDDGPMEDRLGIEGDVNALSAVIAAKGTEPPLSIGLFGDWGSGKSFFMGKMRQRITAIAEESGRCVKNNEGSSFCQNIVQIPFNAWHYMDANLWASLVTHIFDKLAEHLTGGEGNKIEQKKKILFKNIESAKKLCEAAEKKKQKAVASQLAVEEKLKHIKAEEESAGKKLGSIEVKDALSVVMQDVNLQQQVGDIASRLGLDKGNKDYRSVCEAIEATRGLLGKLGLVLKNLQKGNNAKKKLSFVIIAIATIPVCITGLVWWLGDSALLVTIVGAVSPLLAVIGGWARIVTPRVKQIGEVIEGFRETQEQIEGMRSSEVQVLSEKRISLERQLFKLAEDEKDAQRELAESKKCVDAVEEELEEIKTGRRLYNFILDRSGESKYKDKLGIIAQIREDFKGLSELVMESRKDDTPGELRKIERIVLYIDDLDRCPSDRVVEVLQAIHLILAFKLFIVVVGVDCRWILHALREEYSAFGGDNGKLEEGGRRWLTTPHNYVEKIFQIPFALEQMQDKGYRELISGLTKAGEPAKVEEDKGKGKDKDKDRDRDRDRDRDKRPEPIPPTPQEKETGQEEEKTLEEERVSEGGGEINMRPDELRLEEWEIEFMKRLGDFVSSPRATKRFVNIYMLICATLTDRKRLAKFKGTKDGRGDYQAVQLMLGILTGFPNQACDVLKAMRDNTEELKDIHEFVKKLKMRKVSNSEPAVYKNIAKSDISETEHGSWDRLAGMLKDKITELGINTSFEPFSDWAGLVGRFSFQYGRANEHQADESEEEAGSG